MKGATEEQMRAAVAAYTGPVMRCPPGKAKAPEPKPPVKINRAVQWLIENSSKNAGTVQELRVAERRRDQIARRRQARRIAKRNAPLLNRIKKQDRTIASNMALIKQAASK